MPRRWLFLAVLLLPTACGSVPDTARLAPGQLGFGLDSDVMAVNFAQWAFADPGRTAGRPVEAARAAAAMDYIAGELNTSPRWANIPALTQLQLLQGRREVRRALFVADGAPSQAVVDAFSAAAGALARGDQQMALRALGPPAFDAAPAQVLARLTALPYLQMANISTMHAAASLYAPDDTDWH